ncbi:membrane-associated tyrosine- and threonine-specific cdc2-inhibitory kinase [Halichoeres trimaculatus]|uniref:membrane-associated tyrosine- and threonine-specific cdc2-inhibitory kinase n=1 Tax=Halichoeres trimaculatus TaxID=147232 RepID=UPI003D9EC14E
MSVTMETTVSRGVLPIPTYFSQAEQSFSLKKRRYPCSSSSTSNSSYSSPAQLSHSLPPLPPSKGCPPLSRVFSPQPSPFTPLSCSLSKSPPPNSVYDPSKQQSYFTQCFTNLGLLGRGSFGEVFKVQNNKDGRHYAIKRSAHRFRSKSERNRSVREARNHECLCPHPHILDFVAAWEECGRLYIQTELCSTSLLLHAENQPGPDEPAAWAYLCDLLSALQHLHSCGFVHLDLKPANVLMTASSRLKLGDFGLLLKFKQESPKPREEKEKEEAQEGDARYMAPELLRGEYGPAADVFSLGVSILELACNIEVPNGGEGWQQLRQGCLPPEVTSGLSDDLQTVLRMMLAPDPSDRPTVSELLAHPSVWKHRWKRRIYLTVAEMVLTLVSFCQSIMCFGCRLLSFLPTPPFIPHWNKPVPCTPTKDIMDRDLTLPVNVVHADTGSPEDDAVFLLDPIDAELSPTITHRLKSRLSVESTSTPLPASPTNSCLGSAHTPTHSNVSDWFSCSLTHTPSRIHSDGSCHTLTPSVSPIHTGIHTCSMNENTHSQHSSSIRSSQRQGRSWVRSDESQSRPNFEPKNLLSLFEETTLEGEP